MVQKKPPCAQYEPPKHSLVKSKKGTEFCRKARNTAGPSTGRSQAGPSNRSSNKKKSQPVPDPCPVCYNNASPTRNTKLKCGHLYHKNCLKQWITTSRRPGAKPGCPMCRRNLNNVLPNGHSLHSNLQNTRRTNQNRARHVQNIMRTVINFYGLNPSNQHDQNMIIRETIFEIQRLGLNAELLGR